MSEYRLCLLEAVDTLLFELSILRVVDPISIRGDGGIDLVYW